MRAPSVADGERQEVPAEGVGRADRFAVEVVGGHGQREAPGMDGRADHLGHELLELHASDSRTYDRFRRGAPNRGDRRRLDGRGCVVTVDPVRAG